MTQKNPTPSAEPAGQDFSILELFGTADKSLDQVKKYLQKSKGELERLRESGNLEDLAANIYRIAENGLREDLKEVGITGDAQTPYVAEFKKLWEDMEMNQKAEEIMASAEFAALDEFVGNAENLPKLKELLDSAEPQAKWQTMLAGILSSFPDLEKYLGPDITGLLASLGVLPKQVEDKKEGEGSEESKGAAATAENREQEENQEEAEAAPESFKPGKTLVLGDAGFSFLKSKEELRSRINATEVIAEASQGSEWAEQQVKEKPAEFFEGFENVVIGFGTGDLERGDSADIIWKRLRSVIGTLREKNPNIRIILATVPPKAGSNAEKREKLNRFIAEARRRELVQSILTMEEESDNKKTTDAMRTAQYHARDAKIKVNT